jgi:hypothetical protein
VKLIIVGVTKCGTTSLNKWLKSKGHIVIDMEYYSTIESGTVFYKNHFSDYKPVLIFRNYRDRQKSFEKYYKKNPQFLKGQKDDFNRENIIAQWKFTDPLIYELEELLLKSDFPRLNIGNQF